MLSSRLSVLILVNQIKDANYKSLALAILRSRDLIHNREIAELSIRVKKRSLKYNAFNKSMQIDKSSQLKTTK